MVKELKYGLDAALSAGSISSVDFFLVLTLPVP